MSKTPQSITTKVALVLGLMMLGACNKPVLRETPRAGGGGGDEGLNIKVPDACRNEVKDFRNFYEIFRQELEERSLDANEPLASMLTVGRMTHVLTSKHLEPSTLELFESDDALGRFFERTIDVSRMRAKESLTDQEIIWILNCKK